MSALSSCYTEKQKGQEDDAQQVDTAAVLLKYGSNLFTVPSPFQVSYSIRQEDIDFHENLLNPPDRAGSYMTQFSKALNIGTYGTDLAYLYLYDQKRRIPFYFEAIKKLAEDLRIAEAMSNRQIQFIQRQMHKQDSLIYALTDVYKAFDTYLKENQRDNTGALIITGAWIESNYILSQLVQLTNNRFLINRLGEQKHTLDHLIEMLSSYYYESDEYTALIDSLVDLAYEFDGVIYNYYYKEPNVNEKEKLTIIRSQSNVVISKYHLRSIAEKLAQIRNTIVS